MARRALEALMRDRASFVIAHRLSSADRIVALEDGRIRESGTTRWLRGGRYAAFLRALVAGRRRARRVRAGPAPRRTAAAAPIVRAARRARS